MLSIHPSAIISPKAHLGANIEVGPYAMIGEGVVLGDNCTVQAHAILTSRVTIGERNLIGYGVVIGSAPQDLSHTDEISSEVVIGAGNTFREYVTIHRGAKEGTVTRVGDENLLMGGVHLGHNVNVGNRVVMANNCLLAGYVDVGDDAFLGGGTLFHQHVRVGHMCMVRGGTAWSKDIPPYTIGVIINKLCGLNVLGMRRKGVSREARAEVMKVYKLLYHSGLNVHQAINHADSLKWGPEATSFMKFVSHRTKMGLCGARRKSSKESHQSESDESGE